MKHRIGAGLLALGLAVAALPGSALASQGQMNGTGGKLVDSGSTSSRHGVWDTVIRLLPGGAGTEVIGGGSDTSGEGTIGRLLGALENHTATPKAAPAATGTATWYGPGFHGNLTANGEVYNMYDPTITAANKYPLGSRLRVTNLNNGRSVEVRVTDTGGFDKINPTTLVDLSYGAFSKIAQVDDGRIPVQVERLA